MRYSLPLAMLLLQTIASASTSAATDHDSYELSLREAIDRSPVTVFHCHADSHCKGTLAIVPISDAHTSMLFDAWIEAGVLHVRFLEGDATLYCGRRDFCEVPLTGESKAKATVWLSHAAANDGPLQSLVLRRDTDVKTGVEIGLRFGH